MYQILYQIYMQHSYISEDYMFSFAKNSINDLNTSIDPCICFFRPFKHDLVTIAIVC